MVLIGSMHVADPLSTTPGQNTPGEALRKLFMTPLGVSAYRLSAELGVAPIAISQLLRGKRGISPSMALKLASYFGVEPGFWMALQAAHDLQLAGPRGSGTGSTSRDPVPSAGWTVLGAAGKPAQRQAPVGSVDG